MAALKLRLTTQIRVDSSELDLLREAMEAINWSDYEDAKRGKAGDRLCGRIQIEQSRIAAKEAIANGNR
jgi:hypothetical protein